MHHIFTPKYEETKRVTLKKSEETKRVIYKNIENEWGSKGHNTMLPCYVIVNKIKIFIGGG